MADSNLSREELIERLALPDGYCSQLVWDAYSQLCDNWDDDVIEDLSDAELKEVLGLVAKYFDWSAYFDQVDRNLANSIKVVTLRRAAK